MSNKHGVKNSVKIVANANPPAIEVESWRHHWLDGASYMTSRVKKLIVKPKIIGNNPRIAVVAVNNIGLTLWMPALIIESLTSCPFFLRC